MGTAMRYIQHPISLKLVPAEEYERPKEAGHFIHDDIRSFVSPVDGSIISDRKQLRDHNKRNNVVSADEFSKEHYESKAKERANTGNTREEVFARKQAIYNEIIKQERA